MQESNFSANYHPFNFSFNPQTGNLLVLGDNANNTLTIATKNQYLFLELDGQAKTSDPTSAFFDSQLSTFNRQNLTHIQFDGGIGQDTLILGDLDLASKLDIQTEDNLLLQGTISTTDKFSALADTLTASGSLKVSNQDQGGNIDLLGNHIQLIGTKIDASGLNGGGNIRIGGDYQGKGTIPNAQDVNVSSDSSIQNDALQQGNGGRTIIWADGNTKFAGNISAKGGAIFGDGGFVEVSGKTNLSFTGLVNTSAVNGKIGELLLDPTNVTIIAGDPAPGDDSRIKASTLEQQVSGVSVSASNNISTEVSLSFVPGAGLISFTAGNAFQFSGKNITAPGHEISITADSINASTINTSSTTGTGGRITLLANNSLSTGNLISSSQTNNSGNVSIESTLAGVTTGGIDTTAKVGNGGNISIKAKNSLTTGGLMSSSQASNSGNILIESTTSDATTGGIDTTAKVGNSGNISIKAKINIITSNLISSSQTSNSGNISIESTTSNVTTGGIDTTAKVGNSGNVNIKALQNIIAGTVKTNVNIKSGLKGGNIDIQTTNGTLQIGSAESWGFTNRGGNITLKSKGDLTVTKNLLSGSVYSNGGNITVESTSGVVAINDGINSSTLGNGSSGNIKLTASGNITTKNIIANKNNLYYINDLLYLTLPGTGSGGNLSITSKNGKVSTTNIFVESYSGKGGSLTAKAKTGISLGSVRASSGGESGNPVYIETATGDLNVGEIDTSSYSSDSVAKFGGAITLKVPSGNITATGTMQSNASLGSSGALLIEASKNISTYDLVSKSSGNGSSSGQITISTKTGKIQTWQILTDSTDGTAGAISLNVANVGDIQVLNAYSRSIGAATNKKAGDITLTTTSGKISSQSWIQSYGEGGNTGNITLTATSDINADLLSTVAVNGTAGNVAVKSSTGSISIGGVESFTIGGGNAGAVTLTADKDIISTGKIAAGTPSDKNAAKVEITSTKGKIDTNGQDIDAISWYGVGGAISLTAEKDISVGAVHNEDDKAAAGVKDISLTSTNGNINSGYLRSDSLNGIGGGIRLSSGNQIKINGTTSIKNNNFGVYTNAAINVKYSQKISSNQINFIIGESSPNGITGAISDGKIILGVSSIYEIPCGTSLGFDFSESDITIDSPYFLAGPLPTIPKPSPANLWKEFLRIYGSRYKSAIQSKFGADLGSNDPTTQSYEINVTLNASQIARQTTGPGRAGFAAGGNTGISGTTIFIASEIYNSNDPKVLDAIFGTIAHEAANLFDDTISLSKGKLPQELTQSFYGNPCLALPTSEYRDGDSGAAIEFIMFSGFTTPTVGKNGTISPAFTVIKPNCPK